MTGGRDNATSNAGNRAARRSALTIALLVVAAMLISPRAQAAGPRPLFQMPFACGQTWEASTYDGHWPDQDSIDLGDWDAGDANMSEGAPVLATADGTVLEVGSDFAGNAVDGDPKLPLPGLEALAGKGPGVGGHPG